MQRWFSVYWAVSISPPSATWDFKYYNQTHLDYYFPCAVVVVVPGSFYCCSLVSHPGLVLRRFSIDAWRTMCQGCTGPPASKKHKLQLFEFSTDPYLGSSIKPTQHYCFRRVLGLFPCLKRHSSLCIFHRNTPQCYVGFKISSIFNFYQPFCLISNSIMHNQLHWGSHAVLFIRCPIELELNGGDKEKYYLKNLYIENGLILVSNMWRYALQDEEN